MLNFKRFHLVILVVYLSNSYSLHGGRLYPYAFTIYRVERYLCLFIRYRHLVVTDKVKIVLLQYKIFYLIAYDNAVIYISDISLY